MKKILSFIICLILAACIAIPASAAGVNISVTSSSSVTAGSTITFTVSLSGSASATSGSVAVSFDDNFELVSGEFLKSGALLSNFDPATNKGALAFSSATDMNGEYFKLVLRAKEAGSTAQNVNISVELKNGASTVGSGSAVRSIKITCASHSYGGWQNVNGNQHKRTCSICGYAETVNHTWNGGTVTKQATCKDTGIRTFTCTTCGATKTETIAKTNNHTYGNWMTAKEASCTAAGTQERTCSVCGNKETKSIPATGHSYGGWTTTKEATCTAEGTETRTCSRCGAKETRSVKALGHNFSSPTITQQPTCTQPGEQTGTCTRCGQTTSQEIAPKGHSFSNWTSTVEATCTEKGKQERKCSSCGVTESRELEALGHDFVNPVVLKEATINSAGLIEGICKRCGETTQQVIPCQAKDESTGISVEAEEGVFSEGTTTAFVVVGENDASYASIQSALQDYGSAFTAYEIGFNKGGATIEPGGEYRLIFPNASGLTADNAAVYRIGEDGAAVKLEIMMESDGTVSVQATESGLYALVDTSSAGSTNTSSEPGNETDSAPDTSLNVSDAEVDTAPSNGPVLWIVLAVIAVVVVAGAVTAVILIKKRRNQ